MGDAKNGEKNGKKNGEKNGKKNGEKKVEDMTSEEFREHRKLYWKKREAKAEEDWKSCWSGKIKEKERIETCKACCEEDYYREPKTQNNIWVQVQHEKNIQHVHMTFKNIPVPQPDPPPVPRLTMCDAPPYPPSKKKPAKKKRGKVDICSQF